MIHVCSLLTALLLAAGALGQGAPRRAPARRPPNVVFILADDLGWTDLGCYGSRYHETPNLDRLRREGMQFTDAYANGPNCAPTRACLMTGRYTPRHGVTQVGDRPRGPAELRSLVENPSRTRLPLEEMTLAEALRRGRGPRYAAGHFGKWHLGAADSGPLAQGFDVNVGGNGAGSPPGYFAPYSQPLPGLEQSETGEYITDRLTDEAIRFMEANRERPFFLYLSHFAVHVPLQGKPELVKQFTAKPKAGGHGNAVYGAMLRSLDESVGRVMEALDRLGLARHTLVVFTSDNGGWSGATSNAPLRGYKRMLYEGGISVPLLVRWPGKVGAGSTCAEPVISLDWYPTLLAIAGKPPPPRVALDGESLLPLLHGNPGLERDALYWHFPHYLEAGPNVAGRWRTTPAGALRSGNWKLLEFFENGRLELYNLRDDMSESRNLAAEQPERARGLHRRLQAWRERVGAKVPRPAGETRR